MTFEGDFASDGLEISVETLEDSNEIDSELATLPELPDGVTTDSLTTLYPLGLSFSNAIDIDFDGNFLISSRGLDEITKIDRFTGDVIWRWGGCQNQFNFFPFLSR